MKKARKQAVQQYEQKQSQEAQGMETIKKNSAENTRQSRIEQKNIEQNT